MGKSNQELLSELANLQEEYKALQKNKEEEIAKLQKENDELKYKMMFLEGVANSPYDGFLVVNPYGQKILQNQRTIDLWKIPKKVVDDPDGMKQVKHVMKMTVNPQKFVAEIDYLRDHPDEKSLDELELIDGTILERYSAPVIGSDNVNYGRIWTFHDITERKEIEKQLIQLNADKDRFISILAHDLRNPFSSLLGFSEILISNIDTYPIEKSKFLLDSIYKTSSNTLNLLEDTLMWANLKSRKISFSPGFMKVHEVITEIFELLDHSAQLKNISIENNANVQTEIYADVYMIKAILRNLLSNAIKFTNTGGNVQVFVNEEENGVRLNVADNGVGIEPERIENIFSFSSKKSTMGTNDEDGTGLGLLLCKEFIDKHKGKIWIESEVGKGTNMLFILPKP